MAPGVGGENVAVHGVLRLWILLIGVVVLMRLVPYWRGKVVKASPEVENGGPSLQLGKKRLDTEVDVIVHPYKEGEVRKRLQRPLQHREALQRHSIVPQDSCHVLRCGRAGQRYWDHQPFSFSTGPSPEIIQGNGLLRALAKREALDEAVG